MSRQMSSTGGAEECSSKGFRPMAPHRLVLTYRSSPDYPLAVVLRDSASETFAPFRASWNRSRSWIAGPSARHATLEKGRDLAIIRKVVCEPSGGLGSVRQIALADVQVPQREFGFGVCEEVGIHRCGLTHVDERLLSVAAAEPPPRAPGHLRVDDVIDPGAGDARSHVSSIMCEHRIERSSRFPVLVPTGLSAQETELKPPSSTTDRGAAASTAPDGGVSRAAAAPLHIRRRCVSARVESGELLTDLRRPLPVGVRTRSKRFEVPVERDEIRP